MAENSSPPSMLNNSRNYASDLEIDAAFKNLPRYKAIALLDKKFHDAMEKIANSCDQTELLNLLFTIKHNEKIHPSLMALKKPVSVNNENFSFNMKIQFSFQAKEIQTYIHVIYNNREHIITSSNHPKTEAEIAYSKVLKELEKTYKEF